jgi:multiple sugar transport system permease protein
MAHPSGGNRMTYRRLRQSGYIKTIVGVVFVAIYLFPVYWMVATSLKSFSDIFAVPPQIVPIPPDFTAYQTEVIENPELITVLTNSVIISFGTMMLTLLLAVPGAYALARLNLRGSGIVLLIVLVSQLLPSIVIAGPLFLSFSRIGLLNSHLGLILADTTITLPFSVIILRPFFLAVPSELEAAAKVDGCTQLGVLWRIVLPYVRPGLITVGAFAFLITWGEFVFALSLNTNANQPVTVALNKFIGQYGTEWNHLMAVSTVAALPIILTFASLQRFIVGGLTTGAVKE